MKPEQRDNTDTPQAPSEPGTKRWVKRLGAGAFLFFLIKGLLWLIVPAALVYFGWGSGDEAAR